MSGNVKILDNDGIAYVVYPVSTVDRDKFNQTIQALTAALQKTVHEKLFGTNGKALLTGTAFSGSTRHAMNMALGRDWYSLNKTSIGDVDLLVDKKFFDQKKLVPNEKLGRFHIIGIKKTHLIHLILEDDHQRFQVDINPVEYINDEPHPFYSKLSTTSPLIDLKKGLPGFTHKYLLMSCVKACAVLTDVVVKKKNNFENKDQVNKYTFSVQYGMRDAYEQTEDSVIVRELTAKTAREYVNDPERIATILFKNSKADIYSFSELVRTIRKYWKGQDEKIIRLLNHFQTYLDEDHNIDVSLKSKILREYQSIWLENTTLP